MTSTNRGPCREGVTCPAVRARVMVTVALSVSAVLWLALSWQYPRLGLGAPLLLAALFVNYRAYRRRTRPGKATR